MSAKQETVREQVPPEVRQKEQEKFTANREKQSAKTNTQTTQKTQTQTQASRGGLLGKMKNLAEDKGRTQEHTQKTETPKKEASKEEPKSVPRKEVNVRARGRQVPMKPKGGREAVQKNPKLRRKKNLNRCRRRR